MHRLLFFLVCIVCNFILRELTCCAEYSLLLYGLRTFTFHRVIVNQLLTETIRVVPLHILLFKFFFPQSACQIAVHTNFNYS